VALTSVARELSSDGQKMTSVAFVATEDHNSVATGSSSVARRVMHASLEGSQATLYKLEC
jgi:hypothetical protein